MKQRPKLGQNFLIDERARHRIVDALGDISARTVIEIGPGHGAITSILAPRCRRLIAVEIDPALAAELRFKFRECPQVEIVHADILATNLTQLLGPDRADVIGNLPYYITSDILLMLFAAVRSPDATGGLPFARAVLMMQREVADRIAAAPGVRDYGLLSATTQLHARAETLFTLAPECFSPPPEVYSTVVRLDFAPRYAELHVEPAAFESFLRQCFAQKRKTLANNLRAAGYTPAELQAAWPPEIAPQARAESLALEAMALLHRALGSRNSAV